MKGADLAAIDSKRLRLFYGHGEPPRSCSTNSPDCRIVRLARRIR
jgi:hypothetical protein